MTTVTCDDCGKKLCEADIQQGEIRIKCKCGKTNTYIVKQDIKPLGHLYRIVEPERKRNGSSPEA